MDGLKLVVKMSQHPAFIVNIKGEILYSNVHLDKICHGALSLYDVFCKKTEVIFTNLEKSKDIGKQVNLEIFINCTEKNIPYLCSLTNMGNISLIHLLPAVAFKSLEAMIFKKIAKYPSDSRWILDSGLKTIEFKADSDSMFYGMEPGFNFFNAIDFEDHFDFLEKLRLAKVTQGSVQTIAVKVQKKHGPAKIEANIEYLEDPLFGSRYLISSREIITNKARDILERIAEVKGFEKDKELAKYLNVSVPHLRNLRTSGKLPPKIICNTLEDEWLQYWWLVHGMGEKNFKE